MNYFSSFILFLLFIDLFGNIQGCDRSVEMLPAELIHLFLFHKNIFRPVYLTYSI